MKIDCKNDYYSPHFAWKKVVRKTPFKEIRKYSQGELTFQKSETSSSIDQDFFPSDCLKIDSEKVNKDCEYLSSILMKQLEYDDLDIDDEKVSNLNSIVAEISNQDSTKKIKGVKLKSILFMQLPIIGLKHEESLIKFEKVFRIYKHKKSSIQERPDYHHRSEESLHLKFNEVDRRMPIFSIKRIPRKSVQLYCRDPQDVASNESESSTSPEPQRHMKIFRIQRGREIETENNTESLTGESHEENNKNFRIYFHIEKHYRNKIAKAKHEISKGGASIENCAKSPAHIDIDEYYQILVRKLEEKYICEKSQTDSICFPEWLSNIKICQENRLSLVCKLLYGISTGQTPIAYPKCVRSAGKIAN